jgi:hypothetical protein
MSSRTKNIWTFSQPITLVIGEERFVTGSRSELLVFEGVQMVEDVEGSPLAEARSRRYSPLRARDRWAFRVGGRVLAVAKPSGSSGISKTEPGDEFTLTLAEEVTRVRKDFRKHLLPFAKLIGTTDNGTQLKV